MYLSNGLINAIASHSAITSLPIFFQTKQNVESNNIIMTNSIPSLIVALINTNNNNSYLDIQNLLCALANLKDLKKFVIILYQSIFSSYHH
jgi:hypothetical protein